MAARSPRWLVGLLHCTGEPGASPPMPMAPVGPRVTVCRGCLTGGSTGRATSARMPSTGAAAPLSMLCASSAALTACCARFCSYLWCGSIPYEALLNITVRAQRAGLWRLEAASMLACNSSGVVRPPGAGVPHCLAFRANLRPRARRSRPPAHRSSVRDQSSQLHVL